MNISHSEMSLGIIQFFSQVSYIYSFIRYKSDSLFAVQISEIHCAVQLFNSPHRKIAVSFFFKQSQNVGAFGQLVLSFLFFILVQFIPGFLGYVGGTSHRNRVMMGNMGFSRNFYQVFINAFRLG